MSRAIDFEKITQEVIETAAKRAVEHIIGERLSWGRGNDEIDKLVKQEATRLLTTDPEINSALRRQLLDAINRERKS